MKVIENQASHATPKRFLRLPKLLTRIGISRSSLYVLIGNGEFPKPINLGARSVGWLESDAEAWMVAKIENSRSARNADSNEEGFDKTLTAKLPSSRGTSSAARKGA